MSDTNRKEPMSKPRKFYTIIHGDCEKNSRMKTKAQAETAARKAAESRPGLVVHVMECVDAFMAYEPESVRVVLQDEP